LTSSEESCRKKLIDNRKLLEELLSGLKQQANRDVKYASVLCFVSLLRSDKMNKSILMEVGEFHKELLSIFTSAEKDHQMQLTACKALCNLSLDFERHLIKDEAFLRRLVELTHPECNPDIRVVSCYTLKNLLFKCKPDVRDTVMKVLTYTHLMHLLDEDDTHSMAVEESKTASTSELESKS
jgi:hypothetical protein